ncbi:tRNA lysidine(34) synthetase TilS [Sphaerotilus mobilis]|uniref:tRNA(Ile)-lysidine synthase n=1 Tax=Sphaerotilus mobilis TaxID=47994 RepID=A0A4Q7LVG8_9BURK|nr:tRNA lysidine(34) synthetase TilS [Sphaerotilus mobilis]RZS58327.1 tRNA(Ile)-lysidine synthase [Sphaerotilus mobilis]
MTDAMPAAMPAALELDDLPALAGLRHVAVAYSGGRDSSVLLHMACWWAARSGVQVHALHVQHGLSAHAAAWEAHCAAQVQAWSDLCHVDLRVRRLALVVPPGASLEAHARTARYQALAEMAREAGCDTVLLAHHRDDQVETFLLQALRGAGPSGLSAMPGDIVRDGLRWVRPWLDRPRAELEAHRVAHRLSHVEDDSNADPRMARNRLRLKVLPALRSAFAQADEALLTSVRMAQDARVCLDALAQVDLSAVRDPDDPQALSIARLAGLDPARRRNLLRRWLLDQGERAPGQSQLMRLSTEPLQAPDGRWATPGGVVHAYRARLRWVAQGDAVPRGAPICRVPLQAGRYEVPEWLGSVVIESADTGGIALAGVDAVELRARRGGEQFQSHTGGPPRSLKKQFQAAGVPPWARQAPLLWRGDALVLVPGLGVDARARAPDGQAQWSLSWEPWPAAGR